MTDGASAVAARPPLKAITLLMPVWGYRYVSQFLEFCLPTLLAPRNVPAIGRTLPCRLVLLTSEQDASLLRAHPAWRELGRHCAAEIELIDDLITDGNHSATITLAYARAVRAAGEAMLDTCFLFLTSDYLFADGALTGVVGRISSGLSGVVAGNYQIVAEDAIPLLRRRIDPAATSLSLPPRELVRWSLTLLHPATAANVVNFGLSHNRHVNRLFWRVDDDTMIGRFYLMHMIAIRPEVTNFVVGASCDYSFIPEMCPSGNVAPITDSDEYLVVEMQPRNHEGRNLLPGPLQVRALAASLSEWTTAAHRRNVESTLVYHAADVPAAVKQTTAEADALVGKVRALLPKKPHPHRHHHYWIGSLEVNRARSRRPLDRQEWERLLGEPMPKGGVAGLAWRLRARTFGTAPDVTRLHPRWADYGLPLKTLVRLSADGPLLLVVNRPDDYADRLDRAVREIAAYECERLMDMPRPLYVPLVGTFHLCLLVLTEGQAAHADEFVTRIGPLLAPGGRIMVMVMNDRSLGTAGDFGQALARLSTRLAGASAWLADVYYVPAGRARWAIFQALNRLARRGDIAGWRSPLRLALFGCLGVPLVAASYLSSLATRAVTTPPRSGLWSSVYLILRRPEGAAMPLPAFAAERDPVATGGDHSSSQWPEKSRVRTPSLVAPTQAVAAIGRKN